MSDPGMPAKIVLQQRIRELEAENARLREAHRDQFEASGYCYVCDQHDHAADCPAGDPRLTDLKGQR